MHLTMLNLCICFGLIKLANKSKSVLFTRFHIFLTLFRILNHPPLTCVFCEIRWWIWVGTSDPQNGHSFAIVIIVIYGQFQKHIPLVSQVIELSFGEFLQYAHPVCPDEDAFGLEHLCFSQASLNSCKCSCFRQMKVIDPMEPCSPLRCTMLFASASSSLNGLELGYSVIFLT